MNRDYLFITDIMLPNKLLHKTQKCEMYTIHLSTGPFIHILFKLVKILLIFIYCYGRLQCVLLS